ncbi:MAG: hypothetical protein ABIG42_01355, partial [bacterium]
RRSTFSYDEKCLFTHGQAFRRHSVVVREPFAKIAPRKSTRKLSYVGFVNTFEHSQKKVKIFTGWNLHGYLDFTKIIPRGVQPAFILSKVEVPTASQPVGHRRYGATVIHLDTS